LFAKWRSEAQNDVKLGFHYLQEAPMKRSIFLTALVAVLAAAAPARAQIQIRFGDPAPEFPPGPFTDGGHYKVTDFKDKLLVLFFFDSTCPKCRASIAERSMVAREMQGKGVKFIAVGANITLAQAQAYQNQTGLAMPVFADSLGLLQARHGFKISLENIWQFRVYGPKGLEGVAMDKEALATALKKSGVKTKYDTDNYDKKLRPALELLEFGQYGPGLKALAPFTKTSNKTVAEGARQLSADTKSEVMRWKVDADDMAALEPMKAYDLYQNVAAALPNDALGKTALAAAKKLALDKTVAPELAGRKAFAALTQSMGEVTIQGRPIILQKCQALMKKHRGTQAAEQAEDLFKELGGKEPARKVSK
jgi:peroxiredoxin